MKKLGCLALILLHAVHILADAPSPRTTCPEYVAENWNTSCSCVASSGSNDVPASFTWPGHSDTEVLTLQNVTRNSNGTNYTCEGWRDGRLVSSTVYTLKVAYGPSEENIQINSSYIHGPLQPFNLTCLATDVYPLPTYEWNGVRCDNGNTGSTCTFTPRSGMAVKVTCIVKPSGSRFSKEALKTVYLQFKDDQDDGGSAIIIIDVAEGAGAALGHQPSPAMESKMDPEDRKWKAKIIIFIVVAAVVVAALALLSALIYLKLRVTGDSAPAAVGPIVTASRTSRVSFVLPPS